MIKMRDLLNESNETIVSVIDSICQKYNCKVRKKKNSDLTEYVFSFTDRGWRGGIDFGSKLEKYQQQEKFTGEFVSDLSDQIVKLGMKPSFSVNLGSQVSVEMRIKNNS